MNSQSIVQKLLLRIILFGVFGVSLNWLLAPETITLTHIAMTVFIFALLNVLAELFQKLRNEKT